ncbi:MAG: nitrile hydratase subunit alpha [Betaproteobacteria bacterium]|nr:nitrile hydratase subunit alpha [Betaproteobacteria bacterium]
MSEHHHHDHSHGHGHDGHAHAPGERHPFQPDDDDALTYPRRLEIALRELLIEKQVISADEVRSAIEDMDARTPARGAQVVARAWVDPAFKVQLLADANAACASLGLDLGVSELKLVAVENTAAVHHVIVCTLCSCYPRALLGLPPGWYKSFAYRSRVVKEPRAVLAEFGLDLAQDVALRVHDSTADLRYIVVPMRPQGTESMGEAELAALVTRDSMIGVAQARRPS